MVETQLYVLADLYARMVVFPDAYTYMYLGQKLRELLQKHGSFRELELHLTKYRNKAEKEGRAGRWVTRTMLMEHYKYTKYLDF